MTVHYTEESRMFADHGEDRIDPSDDYRIVYNKTFKDLDVGSIIEGRCMLGYKFVRCRFDRCRFERMDMSITQFFQCNFESCTFEDVSTFKLSIYDSCVVNSSFKSFKVIDNRDPFINSNLDRNNRGYLDGINRIQNGREMRVWKKCISLLQSATWETHDPVIELIIPADAKIIMPYGGQRKCRADKAIVVDAPEFTSSWFDRSFKYKRNKTIVPTRNFDDNMWAECSDGIHFFLTKQEAIDYYF